MDAKNIEALTYGPENMLGRFANLPDKAGDSNPAERFCERFGDLFPGLDSKDYWMDVSSFRKAWHAETPHEREAVGQYLTNVFNRTIRPHVRQPPLGGFGVMKAVLARDPRFFPAVSVDFSTGRIALSPSVTLLDWLASSLLECRHRLAICKRRGCATPYFVKMHPRGKFCSESCFQESRQEQKNRWWKENRGKGSKNHGRKKSSKGGRR